MALDYATLEQLRQNHPAWRLLCAHHAPLVAAFLHRVFIVPNVRNVSQADLVEALVDELFALREQLGAEAFPGTAQGYLNDWAENDKGWLRKFYPSGTDEPHFDLTPATEKSLVWLEGLTERAFVGTESPSADPVRAAAADERREAERSASAHRRTAKAPQRYRRGDRPHSGG